MKGIIDRFEGDFAVVELDEKKRENIKKDLLPESAKEGSAIRWVCGKWVLDEERLTLLKQEIEELAKNLFE